MIEKLFALEFHRPREFHELFFMNGGRSCLISMGENRIITELILYD